MLAKHPANLALRLTLEVVAFAAIVMWGWRQPGSLRYWLGIGLPLLLAVLWALLRSPADPIHAARHRIIAIPGPFRLLLELVVFAFAGFALVKIDKIVLAVVFFGVLLLHNAWSSTRLNAMWRNQPPEPEPEPQAIPAPRPTRAKPRSTKRPRR